MKQTKLEDVAIFNIGVTGKEDTYNLGFHTNKRLKSRKVQDDNPYFRFLYLIKGKGKLTTSSGQIYQIVPGTLVQRYPMRYEKIVRDFSESWCEFALTLPKSMYQALAELDIIEQDRWILNPGIDEALINYLRDLVKNLKSENFIRNHAAILSEILHIIDCFYRLDRMNSENSRTEEKIIQACEKMSRVPSRSTDVPKLAKQLGMSYENFRKQFRNITGMAPKVFLIRKRIEEAQLLLHDPGLTIGDISGKLGYPDIFSFSRQFKKYTGKNPSAYRKVFSRNV